MQQRRLHSRAPSRACCERVEKAGPFSARRFLERHFPFPQCGFQQAAQAIEFFSAASELVELLARERLHFAARSAAGIASAENSRELADGESNRQRALN